MDLAVNSVVSIAYISFQADCITKDQQLSSKADIDRGNFIRFAAAVIAAPLGVSGVDSLVSLSARG